MSLDTTLTCPHWLWKTQSVSDCFIKWTKTRRCGYNTTAFWRMVASSCTAVSVQLMHMVCIRLVSFKINLFLMKYARPWSFLNFQRNMRTTCTYSDFYPPKYCWFCSVGISRLASINWLPSIDASSACGPLQSNNSLLDLLNSKEDA